MVATRAEALPSAAGSRSRVNTNWVRRMASCFTSVWSTSNARSTSARSMPGTRAHSDRCGVDGSVACSTVTPSVAASTVGNDAPSDKP